MALRPAPYKARRHRLTTRGLPDHPVATRSPYWAAILAVSTPSFALLLRLRLPQLLPDFALKFAGHRGCVAQRQCSRHRNAKALRPPPACRT